MRPRLAVIGSALVLVVAYLSLRGGDPKSGAGRPGSLRAKQVELHWQSPDPSAVSASARHTPTFELANDGGSPVRIRSIQTGCGCATARAEPEVVPPGEKSAVLVVMDPLEVGARAATLTVETDSPSTPRLALRLFVEGYRRPPYLDQVNGDLYLHEGYSTDEVRQLTVETIAPEWLPVEPPVPSTVVPFVKIGEPKVVERTYVGDPHVIVRAYTYPVRFSTPPPADGFGGEITVRDPWVPDRTLRARLLGEKNGPIRAIPSRLVLDAVAREAPAPARLVVRANDAGLRPRAVAEGEGSPLVIEAESGGGDGKSTTFRVGWKPGREVEEGTYHVIITTESAGSAPLKVPVYVRHREG